MQSNVTSSINGRRTCRRAHRHKARYDTPLGVAFTSAVLLAALSASVSLAAVPRSVTVITEELFEDAPGLKSGESNVYITELGTPVVNAAGELGFYAALAGDGISTVSAPGQNHQIVYKVARRQTPEKLARSGDPLSAGFELGNISTGVVVGGDTFAFASAARPTAGGPSIGKIFAGEDAGSLSARFSAGDVIPGSRTQTGASVTLGSFGITPIVINTAGQLAFAHLSAGGGSFANSVIAGADSASAYVLAQANAPAPGPNAPAGYTLGSLAAFNGVVPAINDDGQVAFGVGSRPAASGTSIVSGAFVGDASTGSLGAAAYATSTTLGVLGDVATGAGNTSGGDPRRFRTSFFRPIIDAQGNAIQAGSIDATSGGGTVAALYRYGIAGDEPIAIQGDVIGNATLTGSLTLNNVATNALSEVVFNMDAVVSGVTRPTMFRGVDRNSLQRLVRGGDLAPDIDLDQNPANGVQPTTLQSFGNTQTNNRGQVFFTGRFESGFARTPQSASADYVAVHDPQYGLQILATVGAEVEVAPGDIRTIADFLTIDASAPSGTATVAPYGAGLRTNVNDVGEIALLVRYTDGTDSIAVFSFYLDGDADLDADVDFDDLGILLGLYDQPVTEHPDIYADFNGDGVVDFDDLGLLLGNYNYAYTPGSAVTGGLDAPALALLTASGFAAAVPEPSALTAVGAAALMLGRRRRIG